MVSVSPLFGADSCPAGDALLVYRSGRLDQRALEFARGLAVDPEHLVVVADWPADADWEPVAALLDDDDRPLRLIMGVPGIKNVGAWLADRLSRPVIVADGPLVPAAGGALFVPTGQGKGWLRYEHGQPVRYLSHRFPQPAWDRLLADAREPAGDGLVAEPLPAGVWLRSDLPPDAVRTHRRPLLNDLVFRADRLFVVIGSPESPPLPIAEVAAFWRTLPRDGRAAARLIPYGPAEVADPAGLAQALADAVDENVAGYADRHADPGSLVMFDPTPPSPLAAAAVPETQAEPASEPAPEPDHATAFANVTVPAAEPTPSVEPPPAEEPQSPVPNPVQIVARAPLPRSEPVDTIEQARVWLRATFGRRYDAAASFVTRLLSQAPGLRGGGAQPSDVVADLVAVRLFVMGEADDFLSALRTEPESERLPLSRCLAAGLRRLPSHRGAVSLRATIDETARLKYHPGAAITERGVTTARATGPAGLTGDVDFLIWSTTGRRGSQLEPGHPHLVAFIPGTRFVVLANRGGPRPAVLLRESLDDECGGSAVVDEIAMTGLAAAETRWANNPPANADSRLGPPPGPPCD